MTLMMGFVGFGGAFGDKEVIDHVQLLVQEKDQHTRKRIWSWDNSQKKFIQHYLNYLNPLYRIQNLTVISLSLNDCPLHRVSLRMYWSGSQLLDHFIRIFTLHQQISLTILRFADVMALVLITKVISYRCRCCLLEGLSKECVCLIESD